MGEQGDELAVGPIDDGMITICGVRMPLEDAGRALSDYVLYGAAYIHVQSDGTGRRVPAEDIRVVKPSPSAPFVVSPYH